MCFSPQRRAIFRLRNFKKCSETVSFLTFWLGNMFLATAACNFSTSELQKVLWECFFLTFWLGNVLLATAVCNFSTSQLQKVLRSPQFFNILTWKCASRHSGVQFFNISTSKSAPNPQFFSIFTQVWGYPVYYKKRRVTPHKQDKQKQKTFSWAKRNSVTKLRTQPCLEGNYYDYVCKPILQLYTTLLYIEGRLIELPLRED